MDATVFQATNLDELIGHLDGLDVFFEIVKRTRMDPAERFKAKIIKFAPDHRSWENVEAVSRASSPFDALQSAYLRYKAEELSRKGRS